MKYYRLKDDYSVWGHFQEGVEDGVDMIYPSQHQWKWVEVSHGGSKCEGLLKGKVGQEVISDKKSKSKEEFFKVFEEISQEIFDGLWTMGLHEL